MTQHIPTEGVILTLYFMFADDTNCQVTFSSDRHILYHHHHQLELVGDVAVPLNVRQVVLFCALRSRDARPRLNWRRSSSTVLSQVCLGRPGRHLQFLGVGDMQASRAREWSCDLSTRATWPNNFRRLVRTVSDSSCCPVRLRTSKFVLYTVDIKNEFRFFFLYLLFFISFCIQ